MKAFVLLSLLCTSSSWQILDLLKLFETNAENATSIANTTDYIIPNLKQECITQLHLKRDTIEAFDNSVIPENNTEYANYISCYWKKKKLQTQNGVINFSDLEKLVKYSVKLAIDASDVPLLNVWPIATKIVDECLNVQGKTHGEKAVKMRNCIFGKLLRQRNAHTNMEDFEDIPNLELVEEDCVNELKLDGLKIEDINRHYIVPENIPEFSDFLACYWRRDNLMNKEGNFNSSAFYFKLSQAIEYEILARSRIVYLSDIITESIMEESKQIKGNSDGDLVLKVHNYILERVPHFKLII